MLFHAVSGTGFQPVNHRPEACATKKGLTTGFGMGSGVTPQFHFLFQIFQGPKIVAAWKEKIDKDGPPSAEKTVGRESEAHPATLNKGPTAFPEEEGTMLG